MSKPLAAHTLSQRKELTGAAVRPVIFSLGRELHVEYSQKVSRAPYEAYSSGGK